MCVNVVRPQFLAPDLIEQRTNHQNRFPHPQYPDSSLRSSDDTYIDAQADFYFEHTYVRLVGWCQ